MGALPGINFGGEQRKGNGSLIFLDSALFFAGTTTGIANGDGLLRLWAMGYVGEFFIKPHRVFER
jgi:hypothetical protein